MDCNWRHAFGVGCLLVFAFLYAAVIISMTESSAWTVVGYFSLFLPGLMIHLMRKYVRSLLLTPGKPPRQLLQVLDQVLQQVLQVLLRLRWYLVAFIFRRAAYIILQAVNFLFYVSTTDIIESAVIGAFALIGSSTLLTLDNAYGDGQASGSVVIKLIGLVIPLFFTVYLFFFHSKDSPKQSQEEESVEAQNSFCDHSTPPPPRRHSPIDIAILRSADCVFYDWDQESVKKKLDEHFRKTKSREVVIVRRLLAKEMDRVYEGPLPLLCTETVPNPRYVEEDAKNGDQKPSKPSRIWIDFWAGGFLFTILVYPLTTCNDSGELNYLFLDSRKVVCGWEVYQGCIDEQLESQDIPTKDRYVVDVLPNVSVPSLKTCASFVVALQFADNLDQLFGVIPSSLIADLKGR